MKVELLATIEIEALQREQFQLGELVKEWYAGYPEIFDGDDLRLALSQPNNHFYEWVAAIYLFEQKGYLSLVEKYEFKRHKRKQVILEKLKFEELHSAMIYQRSKRRQQAPDLLVYAPDYSDWFFCEVKGGSDRLREEQAHHFEVLSVLSNKPVYMIKINLIDPVLSHIRPHPLPHSSDMA